jgi:hypothetical protein
MTFPAPIVQGGITIFDTGTIITISANTADYNLRNDLVNNYSWDGTSAIDVTLNINSGINVRATTIGTAAITADLVAGSNLTINNSGTIAGRGGAGGSAGGPNGGAGGAGGNAIDLTNLTCVINNASGANIAGAGGGGGGGAGGTGGGSSDPELGCS